MPMRRSPELRPVWGDAVVVLAVLALALVCGVFTWGGGRAGLTAVVSVGGEEIDRFPLDSAERTYSANGYTLTVTASPDGAQVSSSDCPTQDCVRTGTVSRSGQSIVCLPARFILRLEGPSEADASGVDAVVG